MFEVQEKLFPCREYPKRKTWLKDFQDYFDVLRDILWYFKTFQGISKYLEQPKYFRALQNILKHFIIIQGT